jgi:capsular polysaccharide transport system permease protein
MLERNDQFVSEQSVTGDGRYRTVLRVAAEKLLKLGWLFIILVVAPTVASVAYFGICASDVYLSESRFVVRSPDKSTSSPLGVLLKGAGFSNAGDEIFAAQDYIVSRDALTALNKGDGFQRAYSDNNISIVDRFGTLLTGRTFEDLFKYFKTKVKVERDSTSSITTLTVRAYTAEEALRYNRQLLEMAEGTVNRLNERGRQDLIRFASTEVEAAKEKSRTAALALSAYRNREGIVDPEKQAAVQLQMISKLQDELISTKTELLQLRAFTPTNPQIPVLETRVDGLSHEMESELGKVAGNQRSLAAAAAQYQRLQLETQFADKQLAAAMASLEEAQNEARRKQAYIERIVQPNLPDEAMEPKRLRGVVATLALGLVLWGIFSMLLAGAREHRD